MKHEQLVKELEKRIAEADAFMNIESTFDNENFIQWRRGVLSLFNALGQEVAEEKRAFEALRWESRYTEMSEPVRIGELKEFNNSVRAGKAVLVGLLQRIRKQSLSKKTLRQASNVPWWKSDAFKIGVATTLLAGVIGLIVGN